MKVNDCGHIGNLELAKRSAIRIAFLRDYRPVLMVLGWAMFGFLAIAGLRDDGNAVNWGLAAVRDRDGVLRIAWVQPSGIGWDSGARPGDRLVAVQGQPASELSENDALRGVAHLSPLLLYSTQRGSMYELEWPHGSPDSGLIFGLSLVGGVFMVMGSLVLLQGVPTEQTLAFFALCLAAAASFAMALPYRSGQLWVIQLRFVFSNYIFGFFAYFFLVFPQKRVFRIQGWQLLPYGVFVLPTILVLHFFLATAWWPSIYESGRSLGSLVIALLALLGMIALVLNYLRASESGARYQLRFVVAGTILSVTPLLVLNMVPAILGHNYLVPPTVSVLPTVLIPLSFAYAILRYQLLGVGRAVQRGLVYLTIWAVLLASYLIASVWLSAVAVGPLLTWRFYLFQALFLAAVALLLPKAQDIIRDLIDRAFFKDVYDYERTLQTLTTELAAIRNAGELSRHAVTRLAEIMNLTYVLMLVRQPNGELEIIASTALCPEQDKERIRALAETESLAGAQAPQQLRTGANSKTLFIPLRSGSLLTGFLCLGPKANGSDLSQRDHALLQTVAAPLSLGLVNVRLLHSLQENLRQMEITNEEVAESRRQLQELNRRLLHAQEEERGKVASDIHDEPLQTVLLLERQMGNCPHVPPGDRCPCRMTAEDAAKSLRRVCANLRPSLLDDLGLGPALEWLVNEAERADSLSAHFLNQDQLEERLAPEVEAAFFRVAQEAINNCLRHAKASQLVVRLWRDHDVVLLSVRDNGTGFRLPKNNAVLIAANHLGLIGMQERMAQIGGHLDILTAAGQGTEVLARLQLGKGRH